MNDTEKYKALTDAGYTLEKPPSYAKLGELWGLKKTGIHGALRRLRKKHSETGPVITPKIGEETAKAPEKQAVKQPIKGEPKTGGIKITETKFEPPKEPEKEEESGNDDYKCPECGEKFKEFHGRCPYCGVELEE